MARLRCADRGCASSSSPRSQLRAVATRACGRRRPARPPPKSSSSATATMPGSSFPAVRSPTPRAGAASRALGDISTRFAAFDRLEIGWGDEGFYREVPTAVSLTVAMAVRALFRPGNRIRAARGRRQQRSARRVRPFRHGADRARRGELCAPGRQARRDLRPQWAGRPEDLGPGLYGPSLFFRANGTFHVFNVCNHWLADLLDAAGVPTAPVLATLPFGLLPISNGAPASRACRHRSLEADIRIGEFLPCIAGIF